MKKPELLAPAGNMESFYAAIEAGCDAVYLAGYAFGARAFADNFSNEDIVSCIKYAHIYGVKVYVTVNTIIYERDVDVFMGYIDFLHQNNVDAIIIQDLGMFDLIRKTYPNLEIHISTQMHIHNLSGATLMYGLGAKRVVLARETNIDTIKEIRENCDVELEVFVHGALCFSYSGQCLMSSIIGGRSGNQGKCAGTCRLNYNIVDEQNKKYNLDNYPISMKDLCTIERIGDLIDLGIDSFKIEGRMKRPEYVFLVTSIYRKAIDNYVNYGRTNITDEDLLNLKKIYNRKFTKGYIFKEKDVVNSFRPNHLGINIGKVVNKKNNSIFIKLTDDLRRGDGIRILNHKEDSGITVTKMFLNGKDIVEAKKGNTIVIKEKLDCDIDARVIKTTDIKQMKQIEGQLKIRNRKVLIDGKIEIKLDEEVKITIHVDDKEINMTSSFVSLKAKNSPITRDDVEKQFNKLGDTVFKFNKLEIIMDDNVFIPVSKLNELRRIMVDKIIEKRLYIIPYHKHEYNIKLNDFSNYERKNVYISSSTIYEKIKDDDYYNIYMKKELYDKIDDPRKILRLERVTSKNEAGAGVLVSEIGSLMDGCITDFSFNIVNSYAVAFLHSIGVSRVTLSLELSDDDIKELISKYRLRYGKSPNLELIIYGREELMITKYNLLESLKNDNKYYLQDRFHNKMPIVKYNNYLTIYNHNIRNKENTSVYFQMGVNYLRYEYILEQDLT